METKFYTLYIATDEDNFTVEEYDRYSTAEFVFKKVFNILYDAKTQYKPFVRIGDLIIDPQKVVAAGLRERYECTDIRPAMHPDETKPELDLHLDLHQKILDDFEEKCPSIKKYGTYDLDKGGKDVL